MRDVLRAHDLARRRASIQEGDGRTLTFQSHANYIYRRLKLGEDRQFITAVSKTLHLAEGILLGAGSGHFSNPDVGLG